MPLATHIVSTFTAGELSPRMFGRTDLQQYYNGAQEISNFLLMKQGGAIRRSGTRYVTGVKTSANFTRLVPFQYSVTQTYILEFGDLYMRVYRDSGQLIDPTPGGSPTEITSPWTTAMLPDLKFTQSNDVMIICHPLVQARELSRTAASDAESSTWSLAKFNNVDGPYIDVNTSAITLTPSALTGSITVTASASLFVSTDAPSANNNGRLIRFYDDAGTPNVWGFGRITAYTSATVVTMLVIEDLPSVGPFSIWHLGAWSDTTGWPRVGEYHKDRLWFGNNTSYPNRLWISKSTSYKSFSPSNRTDDTVTATIGLAYEINDTRVNGINWLVSDAKGMAVMTDSGPFMANSGDQNEPISAINFTIKREGTIGCSGTVKPWKISPAIVYASGSGLKVREFIFSFTEDQYRVPDLTARAEHITVGGVTESAYQEEPDSILWLIRDDGVLISVTYDRTEEVVGWHKHTIGGTAVSVESIACIRDDDQDQLWMIVRRTINGATARYIEILQPNFALDDVIADAFFVDSGLTYSGASTTTIGGLTHLIGETVAVLGDGLVQSNKVVNGSGQVTGLTAVTKAQIGLPFVSQCETMSLVSSGRVDSRGKKARPYKAEVLLHNTANGYLSADQGTNIDPIRYPDGEGNALYTGTQELVISANPRQRPTVRFRQAEPLPMTVLAIYTEMTVDGP